MYEVTLVLNGSSAASLLCTNGTMFSDEGKTSEARPVNDMGGSSAFAAGIATPGVV